MPIGQLKVDVFVQTPCCPMLVLQLRRSIWRSQGSDQVASCQISIDQCLCQILQSLGPWLSLPFANFNLGLLKTVWFSLAVAESALTCLQSWILRSQQEAFSGSSDVDWVHVSPAYAIVFGLKTGFLVFLGGAVWRFAEFVRDGACASQTQALVQWNHLVQGLVLVNPSMPCVQWLRKLLSFLLHFSITIGICFFPNILNLKLVSQTWKIQIM